MAFGCSNLCRLVQLLIASNVFVGTVYDYVMVVLRVYSNLVFYHTDFTDFTFYVIVHVALLLMIF